MDLSIFLPDLRGGGAERVMVTLAREFNTLGHSVSFVLANRRGEYLEAVPQYVSLTSLDAPSIPGYNALGATPGLARYIRKQNPDVLLSALTRANIVAVLATELARTDTRLVLSERNNLSTRIAEGSDLRMRIVPKLVGLLYPRADAITAVSKGVADDLAATAGLPRERITPIPNPTFTDDVLEGRAEQPDHPWFNDDAISVILGVGSLTEQKDFPTLIRAFDRLHDTSQVKLVILGEGPQREELETNVAVRGLQDEVSLPGFVDNPFKYMAAADTFVLSSAWEGLPNVLIEAMACGTPVVATDCPSGPREILEEGKHGPLVPVGDDEAMATAIDQMLTDPPSEEQLFARAETYRPGPIAEQYLDVLFPDE